MRIISGRFKGKRIIAPDSLPVRPTTDMAKEGLFNVLANTYEFDGMRTLDLFCGTGNISYELHSRGVGHLTCVDSSEPCLKFVRATLEGLGCRSFTAVRADALQFLTRSPGQWDIVFADPPYDWDGHPDIARLVMGRGLLSDIGTLIIEHPAETDLSEQAGFVRLKRYGRVNFSFFEGNGR